MTGSPGSAIGRYQIAGFLARGETAIIYEALQPELGGEVALKILLPSTARDPDQVEQFLRLASRLAKLDHTYLLPVIDYGREDGVPFSASPIAEGGDLQDNLDAFANPESALSLVKKLALAVDYLHRNEILHSRIGPDHVLLDAQGEPLLTGPGRPYTVGVSAPAPVYLAPEQAQGHSPDERTDVYQLGALLHQLLLGQPPDPDADLEATFQAADLDEEIATVLTRALHAAPDERFASATEMAEQLALIGQAEVEPDLDQEPLPPTAQETEADEAAAGPEHATSEPLKSGRLWQMATIAGLTVLLVLCCVLSAFAIYTVSGRLRQPLATAQVDTNVRSGPAIGYPIVGLLRAGEQADIYGISPDGNWWQIAFDAAPSRRGWVPAAFVTVSRLGNVKIVEPPPLAREAALPPSAGLNPAS